MTNTRPLKNILFDLGGVILDLNVSATLEAFLNMGFPKELLSYPENFNTDIFFKYETGKISTEQFRNSIRDLTKIEFSDEDFDEAWCKMLFRVPSERTKLLKILSQKYKLYILSNTSELHIEYFTKLFNDTAGYAMKDVFTECFYSHEIGIHKPDPEAFLHVAEKGNILAEETLFLDDKIHNVKAAGELGFNVIHISNQLKMEDVGYNR